MENLKIVIRTGIVGLLFAPASRYFVLGDPVWIWWDSGYAFAEGTISIILQIATEIPQYKCFFHITVLLVALLEAYNFNKLQFEKTKQLCGLSSL